MSKKKKDPEPVPYEDVDVARKAIAWHIQEIGHIYKQLGKPKTPRGITAGSSEEGDVLFFMCLGSLEDLYKIRDFIDQMEPPK